jgi:hypothetical protein
LGEFAITGSITLSSSAVNEFAGSGVEDGSGTRTIDRYSQRLANLEKRLKGYAAWIPADWRIVVLVDEDREDCRRLKSKLEAAAAAAGLLTKTKARKTPFVVLNRIAVEELEAWFLGDVEALRTAYPGVAGH